MEPVYIAFGLFVLITAYNYLKPQGGRNYTSLDSEEAQEMLQENDDVLLIDVRERNEYDKEHLRGAKHIPLGQLDKQLGKLPRDKDIVVYCQTGARSIRAIRKLEVAGFTRLFHMHQGLRGWNNKGYPTRKGRDSK